MRSFIWQSRCGVKALISPVGVSSVRGITARLAQDSKARTPNSGLFRFVPLVHQLLLSITGASSAAFVLFVSLYRGVVSAPFPSRSSNYLWYWYLFLRAGVRLSSLFGSEPPILGGITRPLLTVVSVFGVVLFLALNAVAKTRYARLVLDPIAGIFLFAVFPLGVVLLRDPEPYESGGPTGLLIIAPLSVVAIIVGIIYLTREWVFPSWVVFPVAAYCAFFAWVTSWAGRAVRSCSRNCRRWCAKKVSTW